MKKIFFLVSFLAFSIGFGQNFSPTDRDPSFNSVNLPLNHTFIDNTVTKSEVLADGKILLIKGRSEIFKLDGNVKDTSFNNGIWIDVLGENASIQTFTVLPDGKILVGGNFKSYNGQIIHRIARLNSDGSLDTTFNAPLSGVLVDGVLKIVLQQDGKIVIIADSATNGDSFNNLIRLNSDGSIDNTFVIPVNYRFENIAILPDGKMLVNHNTYNQYYSLKNKLSRLNIDGSFDISFPTVTFNGAAVNPEVELSKIYVQSDGKILVSGYFNGYNNGSNRNLTRFNSDGTSDTSFSIGLGASFPNSSGGGNRIADVLVQPDNKILISGNFSSFNGITRGKIARLNEDGSVDLTFGDVTDFLNIQKVTSISLFNDGKILASGDLEYYEKNANYIAKINTDGTRDSSFNNFGLGFFQSNVNTVLETPDGKILVGGNFHVYNGTKCFGFTRLNQDGSIDSSLTNGGLGGFENTNLLSYTVPNIKAIAQQADGKIYLGGTFSMYNGGPENNIIRINPDGTVDTVFNTGTGFNGTVNNILIRPNGSILVSGEFTTYNGNSCIGLAILYNNGFGSPYSSSTISYGVKAIKYQNDGKLLVAKSGSGSLYRYINSTTIDTSFALDSSITPTTWGSIDVQQDNKIIIQGTFTVGGVQKSLLRLLSNGNIDSTFDFQGQSITYFVNSFTLTPDQKGLISVFNSITSISSIMRLNNDGSIDSTFVQQDNLNSSFFNIVSYPKTKITSNGKILLYGNLNSYQQRPARGLIRLMGEDYNFINGQNKFDDESDGCDINDFSFPNMKLKVENGINFFDYISDISGSYNIASAIGNHTITPTFENPSYFTVSPTNISVSFPTQPSPVIQDFCITPNGVHPDLEVTLLPLTVARPGFEAKYRLVYKNKGNQLQSGTVSFNFNDVVLNFVSATTAVSSQTLNNLNWNFTNLMPLETREITITLNVNSPTATPPVNSGFVLNYTTSVSSILTDEMPGDNTFTFNQTVVNSFDPNDKTCLEGATIATTKVGDYVHYMIRFENTGSYNAQNITVKDVIDTTKYDINTLLPTSGSHSFITRILEGNRVEFYFENINLPFADATNDGYVAFKIRTKSTLVAGDSFSNSAGIYFDYNYPITTNTATTTITALSSQDFTFNDYFSVYPNPVENNLNISKKEEIEISSITIYNMLGQIVVAIPNAKNVENVDVSSLKSGNYFVKINSEKGNSNTKFIKL